MTEPLPRVSNMSTNGWNSDRHDSISKVEGTEVERERIPQEIESSTPVTPRSLGAGVRPCLSHQKGNFADSSIDLVSNWCLLDNIDDALAVSYGMARSDD